MDVLLHFRSLSKGQRSLISEVETLVKLVLVMPATNATSERTFSALRRIKTYLRSTMSQTRLNHLTLLHIHKDRTDSLKQKLIEVANMFVKGYEHRNSVWQIHYPRFGQGWLYSQEQVHPDSYPTRPCRLTL